MKSDIPEYKLTKEEREDVSSFLTAKKLPLDVAVTYKDVAMGDNFSEIRSRSEIGDLTTPLTPRVKLNIPIASANMEPVTGADMIVAVEQEGGIGFVPQSLPLAERLDILEHVLRADCAVIDKPVTLPPKMTLAEAKKKMGEFNVSGAVVVDAAGRVVGILGARDWRYETNEKTLIKELMTKKGLIIAPPSISLEKAAQILKKNKIEKLPLVNKQGKLAGLVTARGLFYKTRFPRALRDDRGRFLRAGTVGVGARFSEKYLHEIEEQVKKGISVLLVDTARAFSVNTFEAIQSIKKHFDIDVIVGNVSTPEGAKFLFEAGADCVKVGQGPGEVCRTREVGIGVPQLTAVAECSVIARRYGKTVIADGGIKSPGDIVKALIAGANVVMLGYLLAGTEESASPAYAAYSNELKAELRVKDYYGSASFEAQLLRVGRGDLSYMRRPEGVKISVPVVGPAAWRIETLMGGLRSAMSYWGARNIKELQDKGSFRLQTQAGLHEGIKQA